MIPSQPYQRVNTKQMSIGCNGANRRTPTSERGKDRGIFAPRKPLPLLGCRRGRKFLTPFSRLFSALWESFMKKALTFTTRQVFGQDAINIRINMGLCHFIMAKSYFA
jgi:hypothetical protein